MRLRVSKSSIIKSATFVALLAFLVVPSLATINWATDLGLIDHREAKPIAMQPRTIDQTGAPKLFEEPLLSVTFDDGWGTVFSSAYPLLQKYGISTTQYVLSGEFDDQQYMSKKQVEVLQQTGHQIGCHTVNHPDLTALDASALQHQLLDCKQTLIKLVGPIQDFASPYSSYSDATMAAIKQYYRSQRNTNGDPTNGVGDPDMNTAANFDIYNLTAVTVHRETTAKEIKALIDYAIAHKSWLILTYHAVDDRPSDYGLDIEGIQQQLKTMSNSNIRIATIGSVLDAYQQKTGRR